MYLKALEIQGFKSFADKTRLTFEKDITAIVGPNGSGKSNISDAILWVMGEQRTRALRGNKMEDVIFGGTEVRSPMGYAQVSLILDNSARIFPTEGSELMLTRRYYRSGESEYYINREQVRLKDVHSLLMDTGLGRDGYSIIGQGRIADIISTRSIDRREIFEEAAGISRFRYRKEEAERKLEKTEENLLRVNDKIEELELQVGPLKEQSEKAKKYLLLRDDLRTREISVWLATLDRLRAQSDAVRREYEELSAQLDRAKKELQAVYVSGESLTERMHRKDIESEEARGRLSEAEGRLASCEAEAAVLNANIESSLAQTERILKDLEQQRSRIDEIRTEIEGGEARLQEIGEERASLGEKLKSAENVLAGCRMKLTGREDLIRRQTDALNTAEVELNSMDARIRMLTDMQREYFEKLKADAEKPDATPLDIRNYNVYYLGKYSELRGKIFYESNMQFVDHLPDDLYGFKAFGDPSALRGADYFACVLSAISKADGKTYIVDVRSRNDGTREDVVKQLREWCGQYDGVEVYIETNGIIGQDFYEYAYNSGLPVYPWYSRGNKFDRICACYQDIRDDMVFVNSAYLPGYMEQVYEFDEKCEHDDNIDAIVSSYKIQHQ